MTITTSLIRLRSTAAIVAVALSLQGCAESIAIQPESRDAADSCAVNYDRITAARSTEINRQMNNAMAGAMIGAVLGAAIAGDGNRGRGALMGATAGGLAGYSATYLNQKQQQNKDARALLASINADAATDEGLITEAGRATAALRDCRQLQTADLAMRVRSGQSTPAAGRAELTALKARIANDNRVVSASFNGINQRVDAYVDASAAMAEVDRAAYLAGRAPAVRAATPKVAQVSNSFVAQRQADDAVRARLEADLQAIERLLG